MISWRFQIRLSWSGFSIQFHTGRKTSKKPVITSNASFPAPADRLAQDPTRPNTFSKTPPRTPNSANNRYLPVRYVGYIAGFRFHDGPFILERLHPGMILRAVRQPHNPHDSNAIQLFIGPYLLGYIPRGPNRELACRLDRAEALLCRINSVHPEEVPWHQVEICIESLSIAKPWWSETDLDKISPLAAQSRRSHDFARPGDLTT